jgi:hypothetical protein
MAMRDSIYRRTDKPMSWTKAIILGTLIWAFLIIVLGQIPSLIIYKFDQFVAEIIEFSKNIPGVSNQGLGTLQIRLIRDIVANTVQNGFLIAFLVGAYIWQERKRKRTGSKGLQDPVKGYMSGK